MLKKVDQPDFGLGVERTTVVSRYRESGARLAEAETLTRLGDTRHTAGEPARAREAWQQALASTDDHVFGNG